MKHSLHEQLLQVKELKLTNPEYLIKWSYICPHCGMRSGRHNREGCNQYSVEDIKNQHDREKTTAFQALLRLHGFKLVEK